MTEPINVIFITAGASAERTDYAVRTIESCKRYLRYPNLHWFIADDGSDLYHIDSVVNALDGCNISGIWSTKNSYGRSCNAGIEKTREIGSLMFFLEDDWELTRELDLWTYAAALMENDTLGMIRMGYLNEGVKGETFGHRDQLYWRLDGESPYIFTGHPSLRHMRFHNHAGGYVEMLQPGETELAMAWKYKMSPDPKPSILWPCQMGQNGWFAHIGSVQSYVWTNGGVLT